MLRHYEASQMQHRFDDDWVNGASHILTVEMVISICKQRDYCFIVLLFISFSISTTILEHPHLYILPFLNLVTIFGHSLGGFNVLDCYFINIYEH